MRISLPSLAAALVWAFCTPYVPAVNAATFTVDRVDDVPAATACDDATLDDCSLRGALLHANTQPDADMIVVPAGTYVLSASSSCTYRRAGENFSFTESQRPLCATGAVTLEGAGAAATIVDADHASRALFVSAGAVVDARDLTIQNALSDRTFGLNPDGGVINNHGTLALTDAVVRGGTLDPVATGTSGAGIWNQGTLTLLRTTVKENIALLHQGGGGVYNSLNGVVTIADSAITGNKMRSLGGGVMNYGGTMTITGSTISGNEAIDGLGGGITNYGTGIDTTTYLADLRITNSTISGNTSGSSGGGLYDHFTSVVHLNNVTITDNTGAVKSGSGGGVATFTGNGVFLKNTIIAGNTDAHGPSEDCWALNQFTSIPLTSEGYNLIGNTTNCVLVGDTTGNVVDVSAELGVLTENGGPTQTQAPAETSPAVDGGNPLPPGSGGHACVATDQRGFVRPAGEACDMGSVERGGPFVVTQIRPGTGGNAGSVSVIVSGNAFQNGAAVKLVRTGQPDIVGDPAQVDAGGSAVAATFDLTGAAPGPWDVVVTNLDQTSGTLPGGFVVAAGGGPDVWVDATGLLRRAGRVSRFTIFYGNRGNVDAVAVPLAIGTSSDYAFGRFFDVTPPPTQAASVLVDWTQVPIDLQPEPPGGFVNVPLLLPVVPAGFVGSLQITITLPPNAEPSRLFVDVDFPYFAPTLRSEIVSELAAGARASAPEGLGVTIPQEFLPTMEQYVASQLAAVVTDGRRAQIESLGTRPQIYSLAQLAADTALFGGSEAGIVIASTAAPEWSRLAAAVMTGLAVPSASAAEQQCPYVACKTAKILQPGCTCTNGPDPIWPPGIEPPSGCNPKDIAQQLTTFEGTKQLVLNPPQCRITPQHCEAIGGTIINYTDGTRSCHPKRCDHVAPGACVDLPLEPKEAVDPNDKTGPAGTGEARFLVNETALAYTVNFENLATATAPAQVVTLTDQLDAATLDLTTFALGPIGFGDRMLVPTPGVQQWTGGVDLRPEQNLIVTVQAGLDAETAIVTWVFTSVDPETGELTDDPAAGFLPPNVDPPNGEGSVAFSVARKANLASGTTICNSASIVFDVNAPIVTPEWCNAIDEVAPSSSADAGPLLPPGGDFMVYWSGSDVDAGIASYSVYYSQDGGPYLPFVTDVPAGGALFTGVVATYAFYSVATDQAGNVEAPPAQPDVTVQVVGPEICGNCLDDDLNGKIDALDDACAGATAFTITKASLARGKTIAGDEKLALRAALPLESVNPPTNGVTLAFVAPGTPDTLLACVTIPPAAPGWKVNKKGTVWTFKDDKNGTLGDPDSKDKLTVKYDAKKQTVFVTAASSKADVTLPAAGIVSVQLRSGARSWERSQAWRLTSKGKTAVTP